MASVDGDGNHIGVGFNLPDEILSVIPTDPYDQLDLARKITSMAITSMAIASRVLNLETETGRLRQKLLDKDMYIQELEEKVSRLVSANQEAGLRLRVAQEDNMKISKEKESFALTAKKLSRDLAKLEAFKRQLMQSLNDENSPQAETVDIGTCDQSVPKSPSNNGDESKCHNTIIRYDASKQTGQGLSVTTYRMSQLTPTGNPKTITSVPSPRRYSAAGSPQRTSGHASPRTQYDGWGGSLSSYIPSSQQSSAASSPPRGRSLPSRTRVDGKEFFRQARNRLSLEQFSLFLTNIKELNAQRQSREETVRKAGDIFGMDNKDLYISFQGLLSHNTP